MSKKALIFSNFTGGIATSTRIGIKDSHAYSQSIDFRKEPGSFSVLPAPTREDNGVCQDLVINEVMTNSGTIYAYGNSGYFYKRTTAGAWSVIGNTGASGFGMDYRSDSDSIYLTGNKSVSLYSPLSTTPSLSINTYATSYSTYNNSANVGFNVSAYQVGSLLNTTLQIATSPLNETQTSTRSFQCDIEPLNKIQVFVNSKGTGNWTLTLHDGFNNVLGTATVASASLVNNTWNDFVFTSATNGQVRIYVAPNARTYHFHLTSTVADGTIASSASNDLSSCDVRIFADRMVVTNNGLHPMQRFLQYETFGNGNYLSVWEPLSPVPTNSEWLRHKLVFPQEYEVCGLTVQNEFLVIAAEKTTTGTNTPQEGILFFWDGLSNTYNYFIQIPEGSPQALHAYKNVAYYYCAGAWWAVTSAQSTPVKIRTMPGSQTEFSGPATSLTVYPYAATVRRGIHLMAYPSVSTNTSINFGVYSWGAVDKNYPESFGYNYLISTGSKNYTASNNLQIGMVQSFGDTLHISWRDTTSGSGGYGVDVVNNASAPAATATWQSLIFDNNYIAKPKTAIYMEAYYSIPVGSFVTLKYKINQEANWHSSASYSTVTLWQSVPNYARFNIPIDNNLGRFYEIQMALDITNGSTVTTSPVISMVSLVFDDNNSESLF